MRNLILFIFMFTATSVNAQEEVNDTSFYCYCEVYLDARRGVIKMPLNGDTRTVLCDKDDVLLKFYEDIDILTYMSYRGWDYVETKPNKIYIMRKKVAKLEDAKENIKFIAAGTFAVRKDKYAKLDD